LFSFDIFAGLGPSILSHTAKPRHIYTRQYRTLRGSLRARFASAFPEIRASEPQIALFLFIYSGQSPGVASLPPLLKPVTFEEVAAILNEAGMQARRGLSYLTRPRLGSRAWWRSACWD
jgi:hypothetical protein